MASTTTNQMFIIKDEGGSAASNNVIVASSGSDTIDGVTSVTIATNYGSVSVYSDGGTKYYTF